MAGYKAHMAFGIITGLCWTVIAFLLSLISAWFIPLIFILTVVGSFLPDLDSDTGMPLKFLLTVVSIIGSIIIIFTVLNQKDYSSIQLIGAPIITGLFIYYIIGGIFKKLTHHRGIFHSIPAAILTSLMALSFLNIFELDTNLKISLSLSLGFGYLCHLILDELNSAVNLGGTLFIPNKSLGTALKLFSKNWKITLFVYSAIGFLLFENFDLILNFIKQAL
jgi:membrane-bound metal-dependent hydrolase YbcI (DUF457 family)